MLRSKHQYVQILLILVIYVIHLHFSYYFVYLTLVIYIIHLHKVIILLFMCC